MNFYQLFRVDVDAGPEVIRAAYRSLMLRRRCHPDLGGDHDLAIEINLAYETLIDPVKRGLYDRALISHSAREISPSRRRVESRLKERRTLEGPVRMIGFQDQRTHEGRVLDCSDSGIRVVAPLSSGVNREFRIVTDHFEADGHVMWKKENRSWIEGPWKIGEMGEMGIRFERLISSAKMCFVNLSV